MSKKIIYFVGTGRSGTTLLDIILGNSDNIFSGGELRKFVQLRGCPHGLSQKHVGFSFWEDIANTFFNEFDKDKLLELENVIRLTEYHKYFIKNYFYAQPNDYYKKYINTLFKIIYEHISEEVIIDSSKYPGRALALYNYLEYEIFYINIVRNPISIVDSFQKKNIEQPSSSYIKSNLYIAGINIFTKLLKKRVGENKWISINYEEFLNNPITEISKIELKSGIDLSRIVEIINSDNYFEVGKLFEGNRIRLEEKIKIKK